MAPPQSLTWTCVGRGAIGLLASARLQLAGYHPRLWLKQPDSVLLKFTDYKQQGQQLILLPQHAGADIHRLLVPVKAYDVYQAITQLYPYLTDHAQLVVSHNGIISFEPILQQLKPTQGLWFLSTNQAAYKPAPDHVMHSGEGSSFLAKLTAATPDDDDVVAAMAAALGPLTVVADIYPLLWQKLAINAAINPLTALENCRNGQLAAAGYQQHIEAVVSEVCQVALALGYAMDVTTTVAKVYQVIRATASNYSSMQQDINAGRQTEIEAICGYICQQAAKMQIAVPVNQQLLQQVLMLTPAN